MTRRRRISSQGRQDPLEKRDVMEDLALRKWTMGVYDAFSGEDAVGAAKRSTCKGILVTLEAGGERSPARIRSLVRNASHSEVVEMENIDVMIMLAVASRRYAIGAAM